MKNYGTAKVKVEILDSLPGIDPDPVHCYIDVTATAFNWASESGKLRPINLESISEDSDPFMAMYPKRLQYMVDNFINDGTVVDPASFSGSPPSADNITMLVPESAYVLWTPVDLTRLSSIFIPTVASTIIADWPSYTLIQPSQYGASSVTPVAPLIQSPHWANYAEDTQINTDYFTDWKNTFSTIFTSLGTDDIPLDQIKTYLDSFTKNAYTYGIRQDVIKDGMWWAVESSAFLNDDTPFWVTIKRDESPTPDVGTQPHETCFIISLGIDSSISSDRFDLVIKNNTTAQLFDYRYVSVTDGVTTGSPIITDFKTENSDLAIISKDEKILKIGFMTIAGRLMIFLNKNKIIYNRTNNTPPAPTIPPPADNTDGFVPCKIKEGKIRIFGTNVAASIYVSAMVFPPASIAFFDIEDINAIFQSHGITTGNNIFHPVDMNGEIVTGEHTISELPKSDKDTTAGSAQMTQTKIFGADANKFVDENGTSNPTGVAFHKQGKIYFRKLSNSTLGVLSPSIDGAQYYSIEFYTWPTTFKSFSQMSITTGDSDTIANNKKYYFFGGCPYFFKIKGKIDIPYTEPVIRSLDATNSVLSVSESTSADGWRSLKTNASIVLYNKGGYFDFLRNRQRAIRISWGWIDHTGTVNLKRTFTGLIVSSTCSSTAGKEIITLNCEDYIHILTNTSILNSPIYDGMLAKSVIVDLAINAGIKNINFSWDRVAEFFIPSGYAFNSPRMKFELGSTTYDKMSYILDMFQAYIFFDGNGDFHIEYIPNGILSEPTPAPTYTNFTTEPTTSSDYYGVILDEKNIEVTFDGTYNTISSMTVDMGNVMPIPRTLSASNPYNLDPPLPIDVIPFRKTLYWDEPGFGNGDALENAMLDVAKKAFYPIIKINFKTAGNSAAIPVLSFIKVDDIPFRLMSVKREFNAENNTIEQNYEGEWLGGEINSFTSATPIPLTTPPTPPSPP